MNIMHRPNGNAATHPARIRGFTLVEVLVSLVVLSMGLLGIAKLVLLSAHSNDSAYLRSQATDLAYAMLDDMRGNRTQAMAHAYDIAINTAPGAPGACLGVGCAPPALAVYDVNTWLARLAAALPSGTGSVVTATSVSPAPVGTMATITVQWDDAAAQSVFGSGVPQGTAAPMSVTLETML